MSRCLWDKTFFGVSQPTYRSFAVSHNRFTLHTHNGSRRLVGSIPTVGAMTTGFYTVIGALFSATVLPLVMVACCVSSVSLAENLSVAAAACTILIVSSAFWADKQGMLEG